LGKDTDDLSWREHISSKDYEDAKKGLPLADLYDFFNGRKSVGGLNYSYIKSYLSSNYWKDEDLVKKMWKYAQDHFNGNPVITEPVKKQKRRTEKDIQDKVVKRWGKDALPPTSEPQKPVLREGNSKEFNQKIMDDYERKHAEYRAQLNNYIKKRNIILSEVGTKTS
jgi:hypothetical protein